MGKKKRSFIDSFNDAMNGIITAISTQRNITIHFIIGILIFLISLFFDLSRIEVIILCFTVGAVIAAELINTAIENLTDMITMKYHPKAKVAKDTAAGAVLVMAFSAILIGYGIFYGKITHFTTSVLNSIVDSELHVSFVILMITIMVVIIVKAITKTGTPFSGGLPSGHSALAAAVVTVVWFFSRDIIVFIMTAVLALLVMQSRVEGKIHTTYEVIMGAFVGVFSSVVILGLCEMVQWI